MDIVAKLRQSAAAQCHEDVCMRVEDYAEAADEIERLTADRDAKTKMWAKYTGSLEEEIERLRAALRKAFRALDKSSLSEHERVLDARDILAKVLNEQIACDHDWETVNPGIINSQRCMRCGQWR